MTCACSPTYCALCGTWPAEMTAGGLRCVNCEDCDLMKIRFKKLYPDAVAPSRNPGDAGWDLSSYRTQVHPLSGVIMFHTGIAVEIPDGYFGLLRPRSSISGTQYQFTSSGIIDSSYRGELIVPMRATSSYGMTLYKFNDRIAQLLILPLPEMEFVEAEELSGTSRGIGGFGSTGV